MSTGQLTSKLILHHGYNRTDAVLFGRHHFFDQQTSTLRIGGDEGLLANVGSKLVARHVQHLATELGDDKRAIVDSSMLEDKLNNVVLEML
jgi:hypothetical protein